MTKTIDQFFCDWYSQVFPHAHGLGDPYALPALKKLIGFCAPGSVDRSAIADALGLETSESMTHALAGARIFVGTPPRLSPMGRALRKYLQTRSIESLLIAAQPHLRTRMVWCWPHICHCAVDGYEPGRACPNPFYHPANAVEYLRHG
jgi:hypothetical protein